MLNVYDIVLNLLDGNRIYEPFEWSNKDNIEHIKKIPMIRISSNFLNDIILNNVTVNKDFLQSIYRKAEVYSDKGTNVIDYACLFTDTYKIVGVEFDKSGKALFKSYLLLDEEEEILELSNEIKLSKIEYKVSKKSNECLFLTRNEEFKRNYLLKEIKFAYKKGLFEKINYLYEEIFPSDKKTVEVRYKILIDSIKNNYSKEHNEIFKILNLSNSKRKTTLN